MNLFKIFVMCSNLPEAALQHFIKQHLAQAYEECLLSLQKGTYLKGHTCQLKGGPGRILNIKFLYFREGKT